MENVYGIKIGDVFVTEGNGIKCFMQVVKIKSAKKVVVREIESENYETISEYKVKVRPLINHFKEESTYIKDNSIGTEKIVMKYKDDDYYKGNLYISMSYESDKHNSNWRKNFNFLKKGEEVISDYWMVWYK